MLKKILIGLLVVVGGFFGVAALQPNTFSVTRKIQIDAPPSAVYGQISSLQKFSLWSPWEKLDPAMKKTFVGEGAVGAKYVWEGNKDVGKGSMTITSLAENQKVGYALEFLEPMASKATVDLTIDGAAVPVTVAWTMSGDHNLASKAMGLFVSMDSMMGKDFEEGLANLKAVSEKAAKDAAAAPPPVAAAPAEAAAAPAGDAAAAPPAAPAAGAPSPGAPKAP